MLLWTNPDELCGNQGNDIQNLKESRTQLIERLRTLVSKIAGNIGLKDRQHFENFDLDKEDFVFVEESGAPDTLPWTSRDRVLLQFRWDDALVKIEFELHTEYLTITVTVDFSKAPSTTAFDGAVGRRVSSHRVATPARDGLPLHERAKTHLEALREQLKKAKGIPGGQEMPEIHAAKYFLYEQIWTDFRERFLLDRETGLNVFDEFNASTKMLADFRGLGLQTGLPFKDATSASVPPEEPLREKRGRDATSHLQRILKPIADLFETEATNSHPWNKRFAVDGPGPFADQNTAQATIGTLWPLLRANSSCTAEEIQALSRQAQDAASTEGGAVDNSFYEIDDGIEFVANTLTRGRAIYISSMGRNVRGIRLPDTDTNSEEGTHTLKFLLVSGPCDRWQFGRMLDRINAIGGLRLLAMYGLSHVRAAGQETRLLGAQLTAITKRFVDSMERSARNYGRFDSKIEEERNEIERDHGNFVHRLNEVNKIYEPIHLKQGYTPKRFVIGDLSYRIARSRYFFGQFENVLKDLNVDRIEGWQPYDEFVKRRLYNIYDYIDRMGTRLRSLQQRSDNFLQLRAVHLISESQKRSERTQWNIEKLQKTAELVAGVALAYYLGSVVYYFTDHGQMTARALEPHYSYLKLWLSDCAPDCSEHSFWAHFKPKNAAYHVSALIGAAVLLSMLRHFLPSRAKRANKAPQEDTQTASTQVTASDRKS